MKLSIIIPLYNEEELIGEVLDRLAKISFPSFIDEKEIIVVDDCSTDRSFQMAEAWAGTHAPIQVLKHDKNKGKGAAVRTGFSKASGNILLIQDADLELTPDDIPAMLMAMHESGVQFINGSRYLPGPVRPLSSYRRYLGNRFFTFLTSVLINVKLTDMACGYKLIHRDLLNQFALKENRFGFEAEIIIKALRVKRNNVAEVPVHYFPRNEGEGKKLRKGDAFRVLWTIFKYGLLRIQ